MSVATHNSTYQENKARKNVKRPGDLSGKVVHANQKRPNCRGKYPKGACCDFEVRGEKIIAMEKTQCNDHNGE